MKRALLLHNMDTVATVLEQVEPCDVVLVVNIDGAAQKKISASQAIRQGHKIALTACDKGVDVVKCGYVIGSASKPIREGDCVHVHNLESKRGRGDLC